MIILDDSDLFEDRSFKFESNGRTLTCFYFCINILLYCQANAELCILYIRVIQVPRFGIKILVIWLKTL